MSLLKQWSSEGLLSPSSFQKLTAFLDLLMEWNSRINLTGLRSKTDIEEILIGESILAARAFPMCGKRVLDFGSGAGVPGLVWVMYDAEIQVTSLEIREKKVAFQKEVVRTLGLGAEIVKGRFPEAVAGRTFDIVATRAIRFSPDLWIRGRALLSPGGAMLRFARAGFEESGWESLPISDHSSLLIQHS